MAIHYRDSDTGRFITEKEYFEKFQQAEESEDLDDWEDLDTFNDFGEEDYG